MHDLILTGFMATGKSTVGRLVAERLGMPFLDLDEEIEQRSGQSVAALFAQGEPVFRALERSVLAELGPGRGRVIATGGGALVPDENHRLLGEDQLVICLACQREEIERRLDNAERPMLRGEGRLETLLRERESAYQRYPQIDTTHLSPAEVADRIVTRFGTEPLTQLHVDHVMRSTLYCGAGLLGEIGALAVRGRDVLLVTDETVAALGYADRVEARLCGQVRRAVIPAGEAHKTLETVGRLCDAGLGAGLDRQAVVVGVGGGVVCDVAGMVAATFLRGVGLVLAPTTLLAQVDAAVGGKVGVDRGAAKNAIGAFYPAQAVIADPDALQTLSEPELANGLAEIIKIALIQAPDLLEPLEQLNGPADIRHAPAIIRRAMEAKAHLVASDPYERGARACLNYGHTAGHALEAASGYTLPHGMAVAAGMVAETRLATERGWIAPRVGEALLRLLARCGLPERVPGLGAAEIRRIMQFDKKRVGRTLRLAVPHDLGVGVVQNLDEAGVDRLVALCGEEG